MPWTREVRTAGIQAVGGDVVEKGDGAGVLDGHVVEAVVDEVASGVGGAAHFDGQVELGADAVDAGDDGGVGDVRGQADDAAESAEGVKGQGVAVEATAELRPALARCARSRSTPASA